MESGDERPMPTKEELLAALDQLSGLSDEEREELRQHLTSETQRKNLEPEQQLTAQFLVLLSFLAIVAAIFGKIFQNFSKYFNILCLIIINNETDCLGVKIINNTKMMRLNGVNFKEKHTV